MNILIYHNCILHSCKYSKNDIFHVQNNGQFWVVTILNNPSLIVGIPYSYPMWYDIIPYLHCKQLQRLDTENVLIVTLSFSNRRYTFCYIWKSYVTFQLLTVDTRYLSRQHNFAILYCIFLYFINLSNIVIYLQQPFHTWFDVTRIISVVIFHSLRSLH